MSELTTFHTGTVPLPHALWSWAIAGGLIVNLTTTLGFLILTSADRTIFALIIGYGISLPYTIGVTIGVVRSATNPHASAGMPSNVAITILGALILSLS